MKRWVWGALIWLVMAAPGSAASAQDQADDWAGAGLGAEISPPRPGGAFTTGDLLRIRDLGGLGLSADGRWLAFSVRQADPVRNTHAVRWFVQATARGAGPPRALDVGVGAPLYNHHMGLPQASILADPPAWAPHGDRVAFRRRTGSRVELWIAEAATGRAQRVSDGQAQVDAFAWTASGALVFRLGLDAAAHDRNLDQEAKHGWLQDGRAALAGLGRPGTPDCATTPDPACDGRVLAFDPAGLRPARPEEAERLTAIAQAGARWRARRADGTEAEAAIVAPRTPEVVTPLRRLEVRSPAWAPCAERACLGARFRALGWARRGASVWFLKSESSLGRPDGAPADLSALYEWSPGRGVRQVLRTADLLEDCHARDTTAFCIRETLLRPAHVVKIDLESGALEVLADPNPSLRTKTPPRVRKIALTDFKGDPAFAHLVYPNDYVEGRAYPLVVTQYRSKGFLRGQVGDEYPILPLAAAGFMVVSLDRPEDYGAMTRLGRDALARARYDDDLRDRRSVWSVIAQLTDRLAAEGLVDRRRMALTGLSAGAENVHYVLQQTDRFRAAIASSGAHDLTFAAIIPEGPVRRRALAGLGTGRVVAQPSDPLWRLAWSQQPERLRTPLLVNVGAYELPFGFEGLESLKQAGRPLEIRVFPDEQHIKFHPVSRAGVYANNIMWLAYWLKDEIDPDPTFKAQYARWGRMRAGLAALADPPRPPPSRPPSAGSTSPSSGTP